MQLASLMPLFLSLFAANNLQHLYIIKKIVSNSENCIIQNKSRGRLADPKFYLTQRVTAYSCRCDPRPGNLEESQQKEGKLNPLKCS